MINKKDFNITELQKDKEFMKEIDQFIKATKEIHKF